MPPMVIYDRKRLRPELYQGEISGTSYGLSEKGWIDGEIFEEWFEDHFLKFAPAQRPLLLLLDGHSSHYQPAVVRKAAASGVILFCLPPHVTHLAQPLDKTVFSPLKRAWHEECQLYMINNPGKVVTRFSFMSLFSRAWLKAMHPSNIISGFRSTGVYPFDRTAIRVPGLEEENKDTDSLAISSGLAYIPLYSPAPQRHSVEKKDQFTEADLRKFQERYENQYDLMHDPLYNKWLSIHHPEVMQRVSPTRLIFTSDDDASAQLQDESDHEYDTSSQVQGESKDHEDVQTSRQSSSTQPPRGSSSSSSTQPPRGSSSSSSTQPPRGSSSSSSTQPPRGSSSSSSTQPPRGSSSSSTQPPRGSSSSSTQPPRGSSSSSTQPPRGSSSSSTQPSRGSSSSSSTQPPRGSSSSSTQPPRESSLSSSTQTSRGSSSSTQTAQGSSSQPSRKSLSSTQPSSLLAGFLQMPQIPAKMSTKSKGRARVLTSEDYLLSIEEKEKKKKEEEELKMRRKLERERKAKERDEKKKESERKKEERLKKRRKSVSGKIWKPFLPFE